MMAIDRREFIKQTAVGGGLGVLAKARRALGQGDDVPPEKATALAEPFAFAVVADPHCAEGPKSGIEQHGNGVEKFLACLGAMDRIEGADRPHFALVVGDIHPWVLKRHMDKVTIPVHAVAGNHESSRDKRKQLRDLFPNDFQRDGQQADYYSFIYKGVRFIGLCDAGMGGEHIGQLCSEGITPRGQCEWLEDQLGKPGACKMVFAHIPPERDGRDRNMHLSRNDSRWFNALVRKTRPEAMFFGHAHLPTEEYRISETRCFNVRSCCWNFEQAPLGFLLVRVAPEGITFREIETGAYA